MNASQVLAILRKRWKILVVVFLIGTGLAIGLTAAQQRLYTATAQLFVSTSTADSASQLAQGNSFAEARVQSYISATTSASVTDFVAGRLPFTITSGQLASKISADAPNGRVLINIHVSDPSPMHAMLIADAVAERFSTVVEELEITPGSSTSPVKLTVLHYAELPTSVSSPNIYLNIGIGAIAGLLLGVVLTLLREAQDNTINNPEQITELIDTPVLGVVPWDKQASSHIIAFRSDPRGQRAEAFRHLRTNLDFVQVASSGRILCITSAMPGEGKSATALNIAAALAEGGQRVCLIEADLRKPSIGEALGLVKQVGLTSVLIGRADIEDVLQNAGDNLAVVTSGELPPNPSELLRSGEFRQLLGYLAERVDHVIVDSAPLLPVADGAEVAAAASETLLVIRSKRTTREQIRRARQSLANVGVTPVGAIFSMAQKRGAGYEYYDHSYGDAESSVRQGGSRRRPGTGAAAEPVPLEALPALTPVIPGVHQGIATQDDKPDNSAGPATEGATAGRSGN